MDTITTQIIRPGMSPRELLGLDQLTDDTKKIFSGKGVHFIQIEFDVFEDHKSLHKTLETRPETLKRQREREFRDIQYTVHATAGASIVTDPDFGIAPEVVAHFYGATSLREWNQKKKSFLYRVLEEIRRSNTYLNGGVVSISLQLPFQDRSDSEKSVGIPIDYDDDMREVLNAFADEYKLVVFIAAGNSNVNLDQFFWRDPESLYIRSYTTSHKDSRAIVVGYCGVDDLEIHRSNYGRDVSVFVPADNIKAACYTFDAAPDARWNLLDAVSGGFRRTSAATPMLAAFAATLQGGCRKLSRGRHYLGREEFLELLRGGIDSKQKRLTPDACKSIIEEVIRRSKR